MALPRPHLQAHQHEACDGEHNEGDEEQDQA
jgi:hypothetical protein